MTNTNKGLINLMSSASADPSSLPAFRATVCLRNKLLGMDYSIEHANAISQNITYILDHDISDSSIENLMNVVVQRIHKMIRAYVDQHFTIDSILDGLKGLVVDAG